MVGYHARNFYWYFTFDCWAKMQTEDNNNTPIERISFDMMKLYHELWSYVRYNFTAIRLTICFAK
jgi:hypothetical protein